MDIKPLGSNVIVKKTTISGFSDSLLVMPDLVATQYYSVICEVLAVGPGELLENGEREPIPIKSGDKVIVWGGAGMDKEVTGEKDTFIVDISEIEAKLIDD